MKTKHTPGPWRLDPDSLNVFAGGLVAQVYGAVHTGEKRANAGLIAAAPELLEFVQWYVDFCDDGEGDAAPRYEMAKALLAKAEGAK